MDKILLIRPEMRSGTVNYSYVGKARNKKKWEPLEDNDHHKGYERIEGRSHKVESLTAEIIKDKLKNTQGIKPVVILDTNWGTNIGTVVRRATNTFRKELAKALGRLKNKVGFIVKALKPNVNVSISRPANDGDTFELIGVPLKNPSEAGETIKLENTQRKIPVLVGGTQLDTPANQQKLYNHIHQTL